MSLTEVRFHGRGGQGAWTASQLLALAALKEGKYVQSFPEFGPERMGAPITAFTRISDEKMTIHSNVYNPDAVLVLDSTLMSTVNVLKGVKRGGVLIINTKDDPEKVKAELKNVEGVMIATVPASELALNILGRDITNTAILGSLIKVKPVTSLSSVIEVTKQRFPGELGENNVEVIKKAYEKTFMGER